ncbi:hypothetical protein LENED_004569 [Lentinula edodes]|uniref:DUF6533 domain-containing protein n=1 Tax=Lentinula edodes TaxID=5353 RepID=A0A1Q3E784_LENED|nr:hypothetical protein LENED_004569 [Lentinula edodes]
MPITSNAAAATAAYEHFIKFRMQYSSLAILYYDYVLTFADEIHYMWRLRSLTQISTLLYICCRYAIPGNLMYLLANAGVLGGIDRCNTWYRIIAALSVMGRASVITVLGMRAYAMCAQNKFVLLVLLPLGLLIPILDIIQNLNLSCSDGQAHDLDSQKYQLYNVYIEGNLLSIMIPIYDFIAATFTITRGIQALKKMPRTATLRDSVYYLLVEQGIIYFLAISAITITQSISSFHPVNPAGGAAFIGQINAFSVPVSGLLIARFLLRLRAAQENLNPSSGTLRTAGICSTVQFADRDALSSSTTGTSTFRAVAGENGEGMPTESTFRRVIDSVMNEFGDDPVARTKDMLDITAVEASDVSLVVGDQV